MAIQKSEKDLATFLLGAILILGCQVAFYYYVVEKTGLEKDYLEWHTKTASNILNGVMNEQTTIHKPDRSAGFTEIRTHDIAYIRTAMGSFPYMVMALIAGILAWPSDSTPKKLVWLAMTPVLGVVLHLLQSITLLQIDVWLHRSFDFWNEIAMPLALVVIFLAYFFLWLRISGGYLTRDR